MKYGRRKNIRFTKGPNRRRRDRKRTRTQPLPGRPGIVGYRL